LLKHKEPVVELPTETMNRPENHSEHMYPYRDESQYDELREAVEERLETPGAPLPSSFLALNIPEMATVVNGLRLSEGADVVQRLPLDVAISLCDFPDLNRRPRICEELPPDLAGAILEGLSSDERAYVLREMSEHERHRLLPLVSSEVRKEVDRLLRYDHDTVGGIMTTEFVSLRGEMSVREALDHIKETATDRESIYACYVLEPDTGHLLGAVSLRDLVIADPSRPVSAIMRRRPVSVRAQDRQQ
jgi:magnesium transporter